MSSETVIVALDRFVHYFETLDRASVARLDLHYSADALFKDPFNEVRGIAAIERVFEHMFKTIESPRFVVTGRFSGDDGAMLIWDFHFTRGGGSAMLIRGTSHLRFGADGRCVFHRDYWDAAEELYEKLPLIGALMRFLKHRLRAI